MGDQDKIKTGDKANLPTLIKGQLACVDDDKELWMGTSGGNTNISSGGAYCSVDGGSYADTYVNTADIDGGAY